MLNRRFLLVLGACAALSWGASPGRGHAEDKGVVAAASAFTQAQKAELSGDHARAAELFELADHIAPTPEALRSATRARLQAAQLTAAAGDAEELLRRYPNDATSRELGERVLAEARPQLGRLVLQCSEPCTLVVDSVAIGLSALRVQSAYLTPGAHQITIGFEGARERGLNITAVAGEERVVRVVPPAPTTRANVASATTHASTPSEPREARGIAPAYFWVAASLTAVTGGVALWSGIDLLKARDEFKADPAPTRSEFNAGEQKDLRTTVLLGATGALVAATVALAFVTDFRGEREQASTSLALDAHGAQLTYRRGF